MRWPACALIAPLLLSACGGGSSGSSSGTAAVFNPDADFAAIDTAYEKLPHTDPAADATAMLTMVRGLTDVASAGQSDDYTVWLVYKDGSMQTILTLPTVPQQNAPPLPGSASAEKLARQRAAAVVTRAMDATLPTSRTAYIYSALDAQYTDKQLDDPISNLQNWFGAQGYNVQPAVLATPADLRKVKNASVFYIDTHGGVGVTESGQEVFEIAVPLDTSEATRAEYQQEIDNDEVGYLSAAQWFEKPNAGGTVLRLTRYLFITPTFIKNNMTFAPNSFVFLNGCEALSENIPQAVALVQQLHTMGVSYVLGWDNVVNAVASADSALYLIDRMLGTNAYGTGSGGAYPVSPQLRPFNFGTVYLDMTARPHRIDVLTTLYGSASTPPALPLSQSYLSMFTVFGIPLTPLGLDPIAHMRMDYKDITAPTLALAPSINAVQLFNNTDTLILQGDFGGSAQNKSVQVGGVPVPVTSWTSNQLTINPLPRTGDGSDGLIEVSMDGATSNHPFINSWRQVPFTMATTNGSSSRTVTCKVDLRATFDVLRATPASTPGSAAIQVDNPVMSDGQCSFTSTSPTDSGTLPWINAEGNMSGTAGAKIFGDAVSDSQGGGVMNLSIVGYYSDQVIDFDDTSATAGSGEKPTFDDTSNDLTAGQAAQSDNTFSWSHVAATGFANYCQVVSLLNSAREFNCGK